MSEIKGNTVYMVLYNYGDKVYAVEKIMSSKESAYTYICEMEFKKDTIEKFRMIEITKSDEIISNKYVDDLLVCYFPNSNDIIYDIKVDYDYVSQFVIVPMTIC
jgi:hypothetical protein